MGGRTAWDRYWQADRIASCMDGAGQSNYDHRVAEGWRGFFRTLPAGSRILDLCTGNGAVAVIAAEIGAVHGKSFAITGLDLADIDPKRFVSRYRAVVRDVSFVPNSNCETLAYADASADAIVSQYGIEYSNLDKSLPEAVRVLAPGGALRLFMHAKEGTVVAETKKAIADADFLLDRAKLCDRAAQAFRAVHLAESGDESAEVIARADRCLGAFQAALDSTHHYLRKATDDAMLRNSTGVLLHAYQHRREVPLESLVAKAEELKDEICAHRSRQRALVRAAVNRGGMAKLAMVLAGLGMSNVDWSEARSGAEFVGYVLAANKRRA